MGLYGLQLKILFHYNCIKLILSKNNMKLMFAFDILKNNELNSMYKSSYWPQLCFEPTRTCIASSVSEKEPARFET